MTGRGVGSRYWKAAAQPEAWTMETTSGSPEAMPGPDVLRSLRDSAMNLSETKDTKESLVEEADVLGHIDAMSAPTTSSSSTPGDHQEAGATAPAPETPLSRRDALLGRFATWRKNAPAVENFITTAQRRVASTTNVFASPLSSARLSPAHAPRPTQNEGVPPETQPSPSEEASSEPTATDPNSPDQIPPSDSDDSSADADTTSDAGSFVSRSTRTSTSSFHLAWAAASVVDSVQTQFRGRYAASRPTVVSTPGPRRAMGHTPTQISRMLSSSQQNHIQTLLNDLDSHQYMMLLGRGMLGVNLKQCYLRHAGVYVDYLVQGGAADQTGHVLVGDLLQKVGSASVEKGTILEIPQQIANAKRPLHLIWATGTPTPAERMSAVDVCVALMHHYQMQTVLLDQDEDDDDDLDEEDLDDESNDGSLNENNMANAAAQDVENASYDDEKKSQDDGEHATLEQSQSAGSDASTKADAGLVELPDESPGVQANIPSDRPINPESSIEITYQHLIDNFSNPSGVPLEARRALEHLSARRNHEGFAALDLVEASGSHPSFYAATQYAFLECVLDGRRLPFLARHFSMLEEMDSAQGQESSNAVKSPNAMLMLFCELVTFSDLYSITHVEMRLDTANRIAYKFFLPTRLGKELVPPMFDFHHIAPDSSLRKLEAVLQEPSKDVPRDLFLDFATAAMDSLTGYPFLSFLTSPECARMRAYLRNVAPFVNVSLEKVLQAAPTDPSAKNYIYYMIIYLLCLTDKDGFGEHDDLLSKGEGFRVEHAVGGICAALFIKFRMLPVLECEHDDDLKVIEIFEQLWEQFVDPNCGALEIIPHVGGSHERLKVLRQSLTNLRSIADPKREVMDENKKLIIAGLLEPSLKQQLTYLADELVYEYAANMHPKFREHKFHEWMCMEMADARTCEKYTTPSALPRLADHCIKRLLRKTHFPNGVAPHKPTNILDETDVSAEPCVPVAECAVIFACKKLSEAANTSDENTQDVLRFACTSLVEDQLKSTCLAPQDIPVSFESYAAAATVQPKPFANCRGGSWLSADGWAVLLQSFVVPRADSTSKNGTGAPLYGVSLTFQKHPSFACVDVDGKSTNKNSDASTDLPVFKQRLEECPWVKEIEGSSFDNASWQIGIALVNQRNTILSMRESLSRFFRECSGETLNSGFNCCPLVNLLGNFRHPDIEENSLLAVISPFLNADGTRWVDQPLSVQVETFEGLSGEHLIRSLPPIPLALLFITALLEQKIVFTSSRRSLLLAATTALNQLLKPLRWWHLLVPYVPSTLADDLLQYPAPFILGLCTEDAGIMDQIRDLPRDVTLVDLDVGRVILAPSFAHDCELGRGVPNNVNTSRALRQQVLYMSQSLGGIFGSVTNAGTWSVDMPLVETIEQADFVKLSSVCHDFIDELLAGTASCCYWIEEAGAAEAVEPTVLFDEDRFFHIKNLRSTEGYEPLFGVVSERASKLAVGLEDFDLVLEVFLRCQSMNVYIGSRRKEEMAFLI